MNQNSGKPCLFDLQLGGLAVLAKQGDIDPVTGIVGALVCGITAFHLIEGPARTWLNRNWAPRARLTLAYSATVSPLR